VKAAASDSMGFAAGTPFLPPKNGVAPPQAAVTPAAAQAPRSAEPVIAGERSAGSVINLPDRTQEPSASSAPEAPKGFSPANATASSGGEAGIFNIGPKYPSDGRGLIKRVVAGYVPGTENDDEPTPGTISTGAGLPPGVNSIPLAAGYGGPLDRRGILSHVGYLCRAVGASGVAACSRR
jgi:hypothetical protein